MVRFFDMNYLKKQIESGTFLIIVLCLTPALALIIKGWASACFLLSMMVSLIYLLKTQANFRFDFYQELARNKKLLILIAFPLVLPIITVSITSLFKGTLEIRDLDGPSRYIFALIFLVFLLKRIIPLNWIFVAITSLPILTFFLIDFTEKKAWATTSRLTVHFIDPITFGSICLTFAMLSLIIFFHKKAKNFLRIISLISCVLGIYLSIKSESRTGWIALPIVIFLIIKYQTNTNFFRSIIVSLLLVITLGIFSYNFSTIVKNRFDAAVLDLKKYKWNEVNENTSLGERISYIRMGWYYMTLRPLTGWEGLNFLDHKDDARVALHSSPEIREGVKGGGFHNEYINNAVKFGIFGFIYSVLLVLLPGIFFTKILYFDRKNISALLGLTLTVMYFFSGLTYQVLDFKFTISLYCAVLMLLVASSINMTNKIPQN
jgi:O-antigen ligase